MKLTAADLDALAADARDIVASNKYLTLATADATGTPWATPLYFTPDGESRFLWVSSPHARHSLNIAARLDELVTFTADELRAPADLRLYQAVPTESSVLVRGADPRNSDGIDTRAVVSWGDGH